jgi:hypothetical protein
LVFSNKVLTNSCEGFFFFFIKQKNYNIVLDKKEEETLTRISEYFIRENQIIFLEDIPLLIKKNASTII